MSQTTKAPKAPKASKPSMADALNAAPGEGHNNPPAEAADPLAEAAKDETLLKGDKAAASILKAEAKTFDDWLVVGAAIIRVHAMTKAPKAQGQLIALFPSLAALPSPVRSMAKVMSIHADADIEVDGKVRPSIRSFIKAGDIKGAHPMTVVSKWRDLVGLSEKRDGNDSNDNNDNKGPSVSKEQAEAALAAFAANAAEADLRSMVLAMGKRLLIVKDCGPAGVVSLINAE